MTRPRSLLAALAILTTAGLLLTPHAPAASAATAEQVRPSAATAPVQGRLLSSTLIARVTAREVREQLEGLGFDPALARFDVTAYQLDYLTTDATGRVTRASGLVTVPARRAALAVISYGHGTITGRTQAPSAFSGTEEGGPVSSYLASTGAFAVLPDYLGLGDGPGRHPYMQADLGASASRDLLVAARTFASATGIRLRPDLLVTGFSQGGQTAMALGESLTERPLEGYRLRGLASAAGPYDLSGTGWPALFDSPTDASSAVLYVPYLLTAYQQRYGVLPDAATAFRHPYDRTVARLFDGSLDNTEVSARLPATLADLMTPRFIAEQAHPSGALADALQRNDTCWFRPVVPVRLYVGRNDQDVTPANADVCRSRLQQYGASARIVDLGEVDHRQTAVLALPAIARWSEQLRTRP
ncbi:MAG: alpha/beta hydrolase family protein [Dermatophilaceae bacterium]